MDIERVARGSGDVADNAPLLAQKPVEQGGLADIGTANDRKPRCRKFLRDFITLHPTKFPSDLRQQIMGAPAMGGTNRENLGKTEFEEIGRERFVHLLVDLVDDQDQRTPTGTEHMGQFTVERSEAGAPIHDKEQEIGAGNRRLGGNMGRLSEIGIGSIPDAARVDDLEGNGAGLADPGKAIAGHARLIVDNRHAAAYQAVEKG